MQPPQCPDCSHNDSPLSKHSESWAEDRLVLVVQTEAERSGMHRAETVPYVPNTVLAVNPEGLAAITIGRIGCFNHYIQLLGSHQRAFNQERSTSILPEEDFIYLDISCSWRDSLWPQRFQGRDCQKEMDTAGPALCGSPDLAWSRRFCPTESRGSNHSTRPPHSALMGETLSRRRDNEKHFHVLNGFWAAFIWEAKQSST